MGISPVLDEISFKIFLRHSLDIGSLVFTLLGWAYILTSEFLCAGLNFETFDCVTFWFPGSASETSGLVLLKAWKKHGSGSGKQKRKRKQLMADLWKRKRRKNLPLFHHWLSGVIVSWWVPLKGFLLGFSQRCGSREICFHICFRFKVYFF